MLKKAIIFSATVLSLHSATTLANSEDSTSGIPYRPIITRDSAQQIIAAIDIKVASIIKHHDGFSAIEKGLTTIEVAQLLATPRDSSSPTDRVLILAASFGNKVTQKSGVELTSS